MLSTKYFFSLNNSNRTSYLAGSLGRALQKKINEQIEEQANNLQEQQKLEKLKIIEKEILCLELGGLCHDLGTLKLSYLYQSWSWFIWRSFWFIINIFFFVYRSWSILPFVRFNVLPKSKSEKRMEGNSCLVLYHLVILRSVISTLFYITHTLPQSVHLTP